MRFIEDDIYVVFPFDKEKQTYPNATLELSLAVFADAHTVNILTPLRSSENTYDLYHAEATTHRECFETLAARWEAVAVALRERAAKC